MCKTEKISFIVPFVALCMLLVGWVCLSQTSYAQTQAWTCNDIAQISRQDCNGLQSLFDAGFGRDGGQGVSWFSSRTPCLWGRGNNLGAYLDVVKCDTINGTMRVTFLRLASDVQTIPPQIGNFQWLNHLTVENNDLIRWLPGTIGRITSLQEMFITNNPSLTTIPNEIGNLSNMARLAIKDNQSLPILPDAIGNLSRLSVADFSGNSLTTLPTTIENMGSNAGWGIRLDVSRNPLVNWPQAITNLPLSSLTMFGVCEPNTPAFQTWINNIPNVRGRSGTFCGNASYPTNPTQPPTAPVPCPTSGAWPAGCVPGGSPVTPPTGGGGTGQPCPTSGAWPAGCIPGGSPVTPPTGGGGTGQPCPTSGAWPAGCVPGGSPVSPPTGGGGAGQPCPTSGAWPAGCVPGGSPVTPPTGGGGAGQPCPASGAWPAGCVPSPYRNVY